MTRFPWWLSLLPLAACSALAACSTLSGARPLSPGEHAVGVTAGGVFVPLGGPVPLPNLVVEGKHGVAKPIDRPLDVHYGLNITGLPYGIAQGHVGSSFLLVDQKGAAPALSLTDRLFLATNLPGSPYRAEPRAQGWVADQVELTASWYAGQQLVYLGMAQYIDFGSPSWLLTPSVGVQIDPGAPGGFLVQPELRWYGITQRPQAESVDWVGTTGGLGFSIGFATRLGDPR